MKKLIAKISSFLLFFALLYFVANLTIAISSTSTNKIEKKVFRTITERCHNYERTRDLDIWLETKATNPRCLILGSSTAYHSLNPEQLEAKTNIDFFNCGSAGQSLGAASIILKSVVNKSNIEYVLLDINAVGLQLEQLESSIDWTLNGYNRNSRIITNMVLQSKSLKLFAHYIYFSIKRGVLGRRKNIDTSKNYGTYINKGFVCVDASSNFNKKPFIAHDSISNENRTGLNEIVSFCKKKNIQLVILHSKTTNFKLEKNILSKYKVPIIDTDNSSMDSTDYFDNVHMRCESTKEYNDWIGSELNNIWGRNILNHSN